MNARLQGIATTAAHAESVEPAWGEKATTILRWYMRRYKGQPFTSENVVTWADSKGFRSPTDGRAWGQVFKSAHKAGLIKRCGHGMSKLRATPVPLWEGA